MSCAQDPISNELANSPVRVDCDVAMRDDEVCCIKRTPRNVQDSTLKICPARTWLPRHYSCCVSAKALSLVYHAAFTRVGIGNLEANTSSCVQAVFTLLPVRFLRAASCLVGQQRQNGTSRLKGDQLFDMICVGIFMVTVLFLRHLNAGAIYFWIKDLTQEFLKLQVIYTAVELFDKVIFRVSPVTLHSSCREFW